MSEVTRLLSQIESGDPSAAELLLPLVYDELRKLPAASVSSVNQAGIVASRIQRYSPQRLFAAPLTSYNRPLLDWNGGEIESRHATRMYRNWRELAQKTPGCSGAQHGETFSKVQVEQGGKLFPSRRL